MSGDVFGNGMLLSKHIKLVAAFDHRHVFIDPDPDPARELGRAASGCSSCRARAGPNYDESLISAGRRDLPADPEVDHRSPPQMRAALGIAAVGGGAVARRS